MTTGLTASGDLDAVAGEETVAGLSSMGGGTGDNLYLVAFGNTKGHFVQLGSILVGDRVQVRGIAIRDLTVILEVVEAGPSGPMCCPDRLATRVYALKDGKLEMTAATPTGTLSLATLAGREWVLTEMNRHPVSVGRPPTLVIEGARVAGFGGCNQYSGAVEDKGSGNLAFGPLASTMMACPEPAMKTETSYLAALAAMRRYSFMNGDLVLFGPDGEGMRELRFK
jgi:heat shock protein HslJ